jgi:SAM-dependent methyltransferase
VSDLDGLGPRLDTSVAHPARRYNYLLGGKDNFAADRESAEALLRIAPTAKVGALENRWFLHRAVRFLAGHGIRQFLDVGTGIPTSPNTHEIAQGVDPRAAVVYVDNDPLVLAHARALLTGTPEGATAYLEADLRDPRQILGDPGLAGTLDLTRPVGVLLVAVLHFLIDTDDPREVVATLVDALAPGSWIVASHGTLEHLPQEKQAAVRAVMEKQASARTGAEFAALFEHPRVELLAPGVRSVTQWWAEEAPQPRPPVEDVGCNGLVARIS